MKCDVLSNQLPDPFDVSRLVRLPGLTEGFLEIKEELVEGVVPVSNSGEVGAKEPAIILIRQIVVILPRQFVNSQKPQPKPPRYPRASGRELPLALRTELAR